MNNQNINTNSSPEVKKGITEMVYDQLGEYLFDKVTFINLAYSDLGSGGTTSTTVFGKLSRITDTSRGLLMAPGRQSRLRCQFYVKNPSKIEGYILSPTVYDSQVLPSSITTMSIFRSYVGIKIYKGVVYAVSKQAGREEVLYPTNVTLTMFDTVYTDTFALEIRHNILSTDIIIDNQLIGSYSSDMIGSISTVESFLSFFSPARSTDATSVNIVSENIQFIQNKS